MQQPLVRIKPEEPVAVLKANYICGNVRLPCGRCGCRSSRFDARRAIYIKEEGQAMGSLHSILISVQISVYTGSRLSVVL